MFIKHRPAGLLEQFVESMWYTDSARDAEGGMLVLPSGRAELVVNLHGARQSIWNSPGGDTRRDVGYATIRLPTSRPVASSIGGRGQSLGVSFRPHGLRRFSRIAFGDLGDDVLPLGEIWGFALVDELVERLADARSPTRMFLVLESMLWRQMREPHADHHRIAIAVAALSDASANHTVRSLAEAVGLPQRRLLQLFREDIGLLPKAFARVVRFNTALRLVGRRGASRWTDVAPLCNYFDQSHLVREFHSLAGMTPSEYLGCRTTGHANCLPWQAPAPRRARARVGEVEGLRPISLA